MMKKIFFLLALVCAINVSASENCAKPNFALSNFKNVYIFNFLCKGSASSPALDLIRGKYCANGIVALEAYDPLAALKLLTRLPKKAVSKKKKKKTAKKSRKGE
jgi:hypothetical protein